MVYLDNAATTFHKPPTVNKKLLSAMQRFGANAGRGGHKLAVAASEMIYDTAALVAELFNIENPENIAFTHNATMALNMAIKGVLTERDNVITTSMEHNAVARPIWSAAKNNHTMVWADEKGYVNTADIAEHIVPNTKLIVCNHVSNVCGSVQNIAEIGRLARAHGILFLVDSAQSGGVLPIDVEAQCIDLLAFAGHKALMGPQGTGGLYVRDGLKLETIFEGGSGNESQNLFQPEQMPDRLVAGTMNMPAIAALGEGVRFVLKTGINNIYVHEMMLTKRLIEGLSNIYGIKIYGSTDTENRVGVVSINIDGIDSIEACGILDLEYDIATRCGLHCAPLAHKTIGTANSGTLRLSVGYYNTYSDIDKTLQAISRIAASKNK